jgi:hypothetical protein
LEELQVAKERLLQVVNLFESERRRLSQISGDAPSNLVFADVRILNSNQPDPGADDWIQRRVVRTEAPHVFIWLFRRLQKVVSVLPGFGRHKEEIFGRLGNTLAMAESQEPKLTTDEKVAAVLHDCWEICQDLAEGQVISFSVAVGNEIYDDYVSRSINSGFISQEEFVAELFGHDQ